MSDRSHSTSLDVGWLLDVARSLREMAERLRVNDCTLTENSAKLAAGKQEQDERIETMNDKPTAYEACGADFPAPDGLHNERARYERDRAVADTFDLNDETQLLYAFATDGFGNIYLLDSNKRVIAREDVGETEADLHKAMRWLLDHIN